MKLTLTYRRREITITTEHSASSYGLPVVLIDGELTDIAVDHEADEPIIPTVLDRLADARGIWRGPETRRQLALLGDQRLAHLEDPCGADYDRVIEEFRAIGEARRAAELAM